MQMAYYIGFNVPLDTVQVISETVYSMQNNKHFFACKEIARNLTNWTTQTVFV